MARGSPPPLPRSMSAKSQPRSASRPQAPASTASIGSVTMMRASSSQDETHTSTTSSSGRKYTQTTLRRPSRPAQPAHRRNVALSDRRLTVLANETAAMIHWDRILRAPESRLARWKWTEHCGDFSLYVKHESQRYSVLAIGVVNCSVSEIASQLQASTNDQYVQHMEALHGDQFKQGAFVHDVDLNNDYLPPPPADSTGAELTQLSVKTATFTKSKMLSSHEQWCYLDAVYTNKTAQIFEKHMTTLHPEDIYVGKSTGKTKDMHNVIGGYCVQPERPQEAADRRGSSSSSTNGATPSLATASSKVHFYAELFTPKQFGLAIPALNDKAIRHRLVNMAQSCARLPLLIRRKRLGVQVLIDQTSFFPPSNVACISCDRHLLFAKLCRLCGHGVCDHCSSKHERESRSRESRRVRIESIRVCDHCIRRVDSTDYSYLHDASTFPPGIAPDAGPNTMAPASVLTELLQDALLNANSREMKASVMNVIKCVLDQEADTTSSMDSPASSTNSKKSVLLLTPASSDLDYVRALRTLEVPTVLYSEAPIASAHGRKYAMDPTKPTSVAMTFPMPENEEQRLKAIHDCQIRELGKSDELNMICNMIAKELDCFASLVTVIGHDDLYIAAANIPMLEHQSFPRDDAFCAHTIMSDAPLIVHHPEADIRFHMSGSVKVLGAKYYCGFPLIADNTVIGSVCCVDQRSRELTESQYAYLKTLAKTATKVVRLHADQRKRKMSTTMSDRSGASSEPQSEP